MKVKVPIEFKNGKFFLITEGGDYMSSTIKVIKETFKKFTGNDLVLPTYTDIINDPQSTFPVRCTKSHQTLDGMIRSHYYKGEVLRRCDILPIFHSPNWKRCLTAPKINSKEIEMSPGRKLIVSKRHK